MRPTDDARVRVFDKANARHFEWQTSSPYVSLQERALAERAFLPLQGRLLVIGCAEGADLFHLGSPPQAVGVDLFQAQLTFAQDKNPRSRFVRASGLQLPFADGSFDQIAIRDVLHHVRESTVLVAECVRVLKPNGRIDVVEPCAWNPLVAAHGLLLKEERGELLSVPKRVESLLSASFELEPTRHFQALPLHRILFHPDMGIPRLEGLEGARRLVGAVEGLLEAATPPSLKAYFHVRARKRTA